MTDNITTTIKPFLTVNHGKKAVEFYVDAFGAIETKRYEMPDNKISSVIEIGKAEFYVGDEEPLNGNLSPNLNSSSPVRIILRSKNADILFENAIKLGATEICPMTTEEDWRIGKLKDTFGHIWEIGYSLQNSNMTKREIAQAFSNGQFEKCFDYLTDHTTWNTPGEQFLTGRKEIEPFCKNIATYFSNITTDFKQISVIENDHCLAINGTAEFIRDGKRVSLVSSCDIYEFGEDNKIVSINSYCITERPARPKSS